ncbi:MAG: LD-carboxypeptidase [Bradymonadia bacterium]
MSRLPPELTRDRPIVQVIAPSGPLLNHAQKLSQGIEIIKELGLDVRYASTLTTRNTRGYLAGPDDLRAKEFLDAITDPEVDIVWWARGGSGGGRIQETIVRSLQEVTPKWLVGFSDATSLLNAVSIHHGWTTIHGPNITTLTDQVNAPDKLVTLISNLSHGRGWDRFGDLPIYGGNITVFASMMGTLDLSKIGEHRLLFEDVNESPYRLDRALTQIRSVWPVHLTKEVLLGDLDLNQDDTEIVTECLKTDFKCPVRTGMAAGHRGAMDFIPLGYEPPKSSIPRRKT